MNQIIFWMCITDALFSLFLVLNSMPLTLQSLGVGGVPFYRVGGMPCALLGVFAQLMSVQSPLWHLLLVYNLLVLLLRG